MTLIRNLAVLAIAAIVVSGGALFLGTGQADAMNRGEANMICRNWRFMEKIYEIEVEEAQTIEFDVPFHSFTDCTNWVSRDKPWEFVIV
ncbi:MAG: hypothetical protein ACM3S1_15090 [Hyphomicrobiales bacterium]